MEQIRKPDFYPVVAVPASLGEEALALLRRRETARCAVFASWAELEPTEGAYDAAAYESLRAQLVRVAALGVEPVLCLYRDETPGWFETRGGWLEEDNLRCYLRYVGKTVRTLGHLAGDYITFYEPNVLAWGEGRNRGHVNQTLKILSHIACTHVRAYRLIRDTRSPRQLGDTRVGFVLRMYPELDLRRALLRGAAPATASGYQRMPLMAMAKGAFIPPLRNVLRVRPGDWCEFIGVSGAPQGEKRRECCREAESFTGIPAWIMED